MKHGNWAGHAPRKVDRDLVVRLYCDGVALATITKRAGCGRRYIHRILQEQGVRPRRLCYGDLTPQIIRMIGRGMKYTDIAATLHVSKSTVCSYARQAGVSRANGRPPTGKRPVAPRTPKTKPLRRRCPVDGCYDITTKPVCRNGHVVYEELTDE